jgi:tetratricopeptide (TPR) repeat protein
MLKRVVGIAIGGALVTTMPCTAQIYDHSTSLINDSAIALDRGHFREGVDLAKEALSTGTIAAENYPGLYNNLCIGLTGLRRYDDALEACNKALELSPRSWVFYNNRANIYFYRGQYDHALAEYYKAMTFASGTSVLMRNINLTLRRRGIPGAITVAPEKSS